MTGNTEKWSYSGQNLSVKATLGQVLLSHQQLIFLNFLKCRTIPLIQIALSKSILSVRPIVIVTLEQSRVLSGLSPPLQISQRVVPKPHLSVAKLRFWGFSMHSGGTHGIRSTRTDGRTWGDTEDTEKRRFVNGTEGRDRQGKSEISPKQNYVAERDSLMMSHGCEAQVFSQHLFRTVYLTFSGQREDADTRVTELDEGQAARRPILLSNQKDILGADVSVNEVLILLCADMAGTT